MGKYLIIAAGKATRWNNYLGVSKHLIEIDGEPLIHRTVRQLNERCILPTIVGDYDIPFSAKYIPNLNEDNEDADKFLSSMDLWNEDGRTVVLYGDVYFTDEAMDTITEYKSKDWTLFARPYESKFTGCKWGECFAQSFYPKDIEKHYKALLVIRDQFKLGNIKRCGGWEHYRQMEGFNLTEHLVGKRLYEIDDFTEDFDSPEDYNNFNDRRNNIKQRKD